MRVISFLFLFFLAVSFADRVSTLSDFTNEAVASEQEGEPATAPEGAEPPTVPEEGTEGEPAVSPEATPEPIRY